jgi:hypothetical protein
MIASAIAWDLARCAFEHTKPFLSLRGYKTGPGPGPIESSPGTQREARRAQNICLVLKLRMAVKVVQPCVQRELRAF